MKNYIGLKGCSGNLSLIFGLNRLVLQVDRKLSDEIRLYNAVNFSYRLRDCNCTRVSLAPDVILYAVGYYYGL